MVKDWMFARREPWHLAPGGGMWLTNGYHLVDRLCLLLDARPTDVRAVVGSRFHPQEDDDVGVGLIGFAGGAVGVARAIGYRGGAGRLDGDPGDRGGGACQPCGRAISRPGRPLGTGPGEPSPLLDALGGEWAAFLAHVRGEAPSRVSAEYGRLMVMTVLAGLTSSETGQVVPIG
jgi:predicted dehydrogenase